MTYHITPTDLNAPQVTEVLEQLKTLLVEKVNPALNRDTIDANASILEDELGLDSIMVVEFIVLLEKNFGFTFGEDDLSMEAFASLNTLSAFIVHKNSAELL